MVHDARDEPVPLVVLNSIQVIGSLTVIAIPLVLSVPPFSYLAKRIQQTFSDLVPYRSLISAEPPTKAQQRTEKQFQIATWSQIVLVAVALSGTAIWSAVFGINLLGAIWHEKLVVEVLLSAGMAVTWLYLLVLPLHRPPTTPPWSAAIVYSLFVIVGLTQLGMRSYVKAITGHLPGWATGLWLGLQIYQTLASMATLSILATLHLAPPSVLGRLPQIAPDDTVTLSSWISFTWMNDFIAFGNSKEMEPEDLPSLSMTMQTAVIFHRFRELQSSTLLRRIFSANAIDLALDGLLTLASVVFNYAGPFFLKRILDGLTLGTTEAMSRAYVYAFLAFLASVAKAVTDLLHLWHGRRATVRIKAELIAAIYDKALRRKDASGVIGGKDKIEDEKDDKKDGEDKKKSNADSGKIVNLMASDTTRISNTAAAAYYIYGAPFEIVVASIFLYNILGWSAFAGMITLVIALPLNSFVSGRYIKITQTLMKARDKRISVMTELIGAIQFIKFFAWVGQWKQRAQAARREEMRHLVRSMINSVFFSLLWNLAPLFVTLISFYSFIFIAQRELTVSVAFTAISLFTMVRMPLNVIPTFAVFILQAHVSVKRIEDFLKEDEVPEWVSSLKQRPEATSASQKIGFKHATLQWNTGKQAVSEAKDTDAKTKKSAPNGNSNGNGNGAAAVANGNIVATVEEEEVPFQLVDLSVDFPAGKLTVVSGPTGSGKSAILTALLGEMELLDGHTYLPKHATQVDKATGLRNSVAYAAQTPWLQQKSIKDNILFGEEFSEERYEATLEACALVPDLDMLEDGDQTEIGAKGVSLSGGQKARVALARAVYSYTQHVLLDDPLAAVDSHTAKHLTDKCLRGPLLKGRTVILVSHHVELLLPITDHIVRILDGKIDAQGSPAELRAAGQLDGLIAVEEAEVTAEEPVVNADEKQNEEVEALDGEAAAAAADKKAKKQNRPGKKLVQDEERPVGNVKWQTYKLYIVSATLLTWSLTILVLLITQFFTVLERYWLKVWGEAYTVMPTMTVSSAHPMNWVHPQHYSHFDLHQSQHAFHGLHLPVSTYSNTTGSLVGGDSDYPQLPAATAHPGFYLAVYAIIVIIDALLGSVSSAIGSWGSYRAAITIHNRLLDTVLRSTVRFFDTTPLGRIINRFSKDIETIDGSLNGSLMTVIIYIANLFVAVGVVGFIVPWFLLPAAVISYLYYRYTLLYLRAGRSVRRLEATLRSPIYSGFAELLDGVVSVRAFGAEERFFKILCDQVDKTQSAFYYYWMMNRWLLLRFDFLGALSVFFTTLFALSGAVKPGSAGMAVLSAQSFVSACYWVSRFWGQLEMDFNAVERVEEYLHLPQEPPATIANKRPPAYWPSSDSGSNFLRVEDLEIKYAPDLPTVFKGSFTVAAGEKIGLIGRTGSGKSTLAMSMLRFSEPAGGKIVLDGVDITSIGVDDLRSRITYIPQDAVLFSGTVRENLDPFNEHSDDELLDALARVNLAPRDTPLQSRAPSRVPSKSRLNQLITEDAESGTSRSGAASPAPSSSAKTGVTLATEVSAGGANFSQGQRQLVAMARALLRRSNLIIMDEATASVDFATDEAIQAAIRSEFKSSTLLTIAHRLSSVIDYDRLLVLSDGHVAEFDTPINLLRKDDSLFRSLCEKSGKYKDLYRAAEKKEASSKAS